MKKFLSLILPAILFAVFTTQAQTIKTTDSNPQRLEKTNVEKTPAEDKKAPSQPEGIRQTPAPTQTPAQTESGEVKPINKTEKKGPSEEQIKHAEERSNGKAFSGKSKNKMDNKKGHKKNHSHVKKHDHQHKNKMKNTKPANTPKKIDID